MIKKIALCAVLVLILVPAFAMAAGPQGQGSGAAEGNCQQFQEQTSTQLQNNGEEQMFQNRICSQECEMSRVMNENQSRLRIGSPLDQGTGAGSADQLQDQTRNMTWDRIRGRLHLQDGTGGNCLSGGAGLSVSADQLQDQTRNMTFDRIRGRLHLQDGTGGNCLKS